MPPSRVRIPPSPLRRTERCPSGLRSATGNRVRAERCVAGSNPALSASNWLQSCSGPEHDDERVVGEPLACAECRDDGLRPARAAAERSNAHLSKVRPACAGWKRVEHRKPTLWGSTKPTEATDTAGRVADVGY